MGDRDELARAIADLRRLVASYSVAYAQAARVTSVYTNGATVSWYQTQ